VHVVFVNRIHHIDCAIPEVYKLKEDRKLVLLQFTLVKKCLLTCVMMNLSEQTMAAYNDAIYALAVSGGKEVYYTCSVVPYYIVS